MRIKISKKEAKESHCWLKLTTPTKKYERLKIELLCEGEELMKIFGAIIRIRLFRISDFAIDSNFVPASDYLIFLSGIFKKFLRSLQI